MPPDRSVSAAGRPPGIHLDKTLRLVLRAVSGHRAEGMQNQPIGLVGLVALASDTPVEEALAAKTDQLER